MGKVLRQPKLWITLASLIFIAVALAQQAGQLRQLSLVANGWLWLVLGLGLTWLSILINGLAWRDLLIWLRHPPQGVAVVPLFSGATFSSTCREGSGIWWSGSACCVRRLAAALPWLG